jgi:hypothetical protein
MQLHPNTKFNQNPFINIKKQAYSRADMPLYYEFCTKKTYINNSALYWLSWKYSRELCFNFCNATNERATFRDAEHTREERLLRIITVTSPHFPLHSIKIPSALQSEELFQSSHSSLSFRSRCWFWISLLIPSVSYCQIYFQAELYSTQKTRGRAIPL